MKSHGESRVDRLEHGCCMVVVVVNEAGSATLTIPLMALLLAVIEPIQRDTYIIASGRCDANPMEVFGPVPG